MPDCGGEAKKRTGTGSEGLRGHLWLSSEYRTRDNKNRIIQGKIPACLEKSGSGDFLLKKIRKILRNTIDILRNTIYNRIINRGAKQKKERNQTMTNLQIIASEAIANNIYTEQEVEKIIGAGYRLPIHTFAEWKRMGYIVRKGEHATITTRLWKFTNKKQDAADDADGNQEPDHYYLAKAFLFTKDQVEKIATA